MSQLLYHLSIQLKLIVVVSRGVKCIGTIINIFLAGHRATVYEKKGKYKVGEITDFAKEKGWFFGHFATDELLQSDLVEIGWQKISNKKASPEDKHLHKSSVEINIIIHGDVTVTINGGKHKLYKGDFYVFWPETILENLETSQDTEIIVVRAPSVNDKVLLNK